MSKTKTPPNKIVVFLDTLGRTVVGLRDEEKSTEKHLMVYNPAILNIMPTEQNTMQVQIIPIIFKELQGDRGEDTAWAYNRQSITEPADFELDFKIVSQYNNIFAPVAVAAPAPTPPPLGDENVIKLFDD